MVNEIYEIKNKIIKKIEEDINQRGIDRIDGEMVDMVKDLAEAEKDCWKAAYYRAVTEAMNGKQGYTPMQTGSGGGRQGYSTMGYTPNMGHTDIIDQLGEEFKRMNPDERMQMKNKVLTKLGSL